MGKRAKYNGQNLERHSGTQNKTKYQSEPLIEFIYACAPSSSIKVWLITLAVAPTNWIGPTHKCKKASIKGYYQGRKRKKESYQKKKKKF